MAENGVKVEDIHVSNREDVVVKEFQLKPGEAKDSEGDEVFEEAMEAQPDDGQSRSLEPHGVAENGEREKKDDASEGNGDDKTKGDDRFDVKDNKRAEVDEVFGENGEKENEDDGFEESHENRERFYEAIGLSKEENNVEERSESKEGSKPSLENGHIGQADIVSSDTTLYENHANNEPVVEEADGGKLAAEITEPLAKSAIQDALKVDVNQDGIPELKNGDADFDLNEAEGTDFVIGSNNDPGTLGPSLIDVNVKEKGSPSTEMDIDIDEVDYKCEDVNMDNMIIDEASLLPESEAPAKNAHEFSLLASYETSDIQEDTQALLIEDAGDIPRGDTQVALDMETADWSGILPENEGHEQSTHESPPLVSHETSDIQEETQGSQAEDIGDVTVPNLNSASVTSQSMGTGEGDSISAIDNDDAQESHIPEPTIVIPVELESNKAEAQDGPITNKLLGKGSSSSTKWDQLGSSSSSSSSDDDNNEHDSIQSMAASRISAPSQSTTTSTLPPPPARPAGLGSSGSLLEPAPRTQQQSRVNGSAPLRQSQLVEEVANGETDENSETREKLQMIRVKFLRLAHRLGQTPHNSVVAQVLYRLGLAEQLRRRRDTNRAGAFSFDTASAMAEQLEAAGQEPLDFSCTIMVLGKSGVGKSATINSIFDEVKFSTDAFELGTKKVQDIVGTVQGIKVRVIDTPGLLPSFADQRQNEKTLQSVKRFIKKTPPDIVLYLDRLDMQSRDYGDLPLLRTITEIFGPAIWFNAIVVLTHAGSAPPDGPNGSPLSYEMFVAQRSHVVQQAIRQAAGDMRLMNPVSLVENHSACRTNRAGQRVLPNGQVWKPQLLLLSFASKILAEANTLLKLQDVPNERPFSGRSRVPPLPFLLSSLLQSRPQLRLPEEQYSDEDAFDEDIDESSHSDDGSDYDNLPPFKRLTQNHLAKFSKEQKKAYYEELDYREKLFIKKQLKEEKKRRKILKKMASSVEDWSSEYNESTEEESSSAESVPVTIPDVTLPASFDSDNPTHRYNCLDLPNQWLVRPVLEVHGWDRDVGYEGLNVERLFVVKNKIPISVSGQITKDKKETNLQMECTGSLKHGEGKSTSLGFDAQTVGKEVAYTLRSDTRFANFRYNKTAAGLSVALFGDAITAGVKLEDKLLVKKWFTVVMTGGAMVGRGDVAYGGSLEATLRDKDYPLGRFLSTLGLSVMDWHGDLAIGCNLQTQFPVGRWFNMIARGNLNNRGAGQVSIRLNSSEQLQIALLGLIPILRNLMKNGFFGLNQTM
ncbi:translocase of chloroplast 120, chloroplastic [Amborella trichopoda]|nr:translocase of chloroplast 120, chloroplastic [Amborella trichopoda]XP_020527464.1 translocase of chloroplast 120, chloroplastic [Amborella trichopoda]|eukprot:XP_006851927.2 translocase of chloroplast 120, chloroplastic [Amborella trichopoda]